MFLPLPHHGTKNAMLGHKKQTETTTAIISLHLILRPAVLKYDFHILIISKEITTLNAASSCVTAWHSVPGNCPAANDLFSYGRLNRPLDIICVQFYIACLF